MGQSQHRAPGELIRDFLRERAWTQAELAAVTGRSLKTISDLVRGRSGVTPEMAACLAAAFGNSREEWLIADSNYRLSLLSEDTSEIEKRAQQFSRAPVREMQRRGWIRATDDAEELKAELDHFFGSDGGDIGTLRVAARRSGTVPQMTIAEAAWYFRAKQLAGTLLSAPYSAERMPKIRSELRKLASHPKEARHIPHALSQNGIRFVVVEPIGNIRVDGAAMWDVRGPVIAVSMRHDRLDGFWFTVMHECSHIAHNDPNGIDSGMVDSEEGVLVELAPDEVEQRADSEAASSLIPAKELDSFIGRVGPLYQKDRIIQFANRIRIHPGIIVGQLQFRRELGYGAMRDQLVKIRDTVTSTALTDGWGQMISPSATRRNK